MFRGTLTRHSRLRDPDGRIVALTQRRFVSMRDPHLGCLETTLVAENWSGRLRVRSAARRHRDQRRRRAVRIAAQSAPDGRCAPTGRTTSWSVSSSRRTNRTYGSRRRPAPGCSATGTRLAVDPELVEREGYVALDLTLDIERGQETIVEKIASIFTSRDHGISEPGEEACNRLMHMAGIVRGAARASRGQLAAALGTRRGIELGTDGDVARAAAPAHRSMCCRRCRTTRSASTSVSRLAASTARRTAGTCSGTSCSSCRS